MKKLLQSLIFLLVSYLSSTLSSTLFSYELVVASMFHNEGYYLKEWIEYHRLVGVDHFWLYNDRSSDHWEEVLQPYIKEGLVEVFDWPIPKPESYTNTQIQAFQDALTRGLGTTKWLTFIDIDEFLLPMKDANVLDCLENHFQDAHAVYVNWRCFGSGGIYVSREKPFLFHLTACSLKHHPRNCVGKTIVRPEFAEIDNINYIHTCVLKGGAVYQNGDGFAMPPPDGWDQKTDGYTHTNFIQLNHYVMRDEWYFQNVRLERARNGYNGYKLPDESLLLAQNKEFSIVKNYDLIKYIKKYYPEAYEEFWK